MNESGTTLALKGTPSITTVIPCYNYAHFLDEAVRSALAQEGVDARVIIVDDASPDDTAPIAAALAAEDDRVTVLTHETNQGHIAAYNNGFALVETEFVTLVSADDRVAPGAFARAIAVMQHNARIGMVFGPVETFVSEIPSVPEKAEFDWQVFDGVPWAKRMVQRGDNPIRSPEVVLRTSVLREVGEYNPALPLTADMEYWIRVALSYDIGYVRDTPQAFYRIHGGNMHLTTYGKAVVQIRQRYGALAPLLDSPHGAGDRLRIQRALTQRPLTIAERHLALGAWRPDIAAMVDLADDVWPQWRQDRRWRPLAESVERVGAGRRATLGLMVRAWIPANIERVANRLAARRAARQPHGGDPA